MRSIHSTACWQQCHLRCDTGNERKRYDTTHSLEDRLSRLSCDPTIPADQHCKGAPFAHRRFLLTRLATVLLDTILHLRTALSLLVHVYTTLREVVAIPRRSIPLTLTFLVPAIEKRAQAHWPFIILTFVQLYDCVVRIRSG